VVRGRRGGKAKQNPKKKKQCKQLCKDGGLPANAEEKRPVAIQSGAKKTMYPFDGNVFSPRF